MKFTEKPKRLVIFLFYDADGIVDSYIPYMLKDVKKNAEHLLVVSNGKMQDAGKVSLDGIADEIFERLNVGFDVWGYKEALEHLGWDKVRSYDEVVMMNYTIMGPVYPFAEMFDEMDSRDVDFWGITKFHHVPFDPFNKIECGYIPEHIQSHFIAVRRNILESAEYQSYWENMKMICNYTDSISYHETQFTPTFANLGYKWEVYVNTDEYEGMNYCPILFFPKELIREKRCPVFKRRSFMHDYEDFIRFSAGEPSYELMQYLKEHTPYDTDMIWENLLRCYNMHTIKDCLHLNYVLPTTATTKATEERAYVKKKLAVVFHAYFPDLIESTYRYINNMPANADVYITTNTPEKKALLEKRFADVKFRRVEVILIENRGRDVSALLVATKDFIMDYDYVCFAHDKKVGQLEFGSVGASFAYHCLENVLSSEGYVQNIIQLFEDNPRLGLLTPMPPIHADYYLTLGNEWGPNYELTESLAKQLDLNVPMSKKIAPIAPLGTMFWFRPCGMKKLFDKDWKYTDFPKEPNGIDGTLLHAIERVYPLVMQDAGYYSAWTFTDFYASNTITTQTYYASQLNEIYGKVSFGNKFIDVYLFVQALAKAKKDLEMAGEHLLTAFPQVFGVAGVTAKNSMRIYYNCGDGFNEKNALLAPPAHLDKTLSCSFPIHARGVTELRFDPGETGHLWVKNFAVRYRLEDSTIMDADLSAYRTNSMESREGFLFMESDPQIIWSVNPSLEIRDVLITADLSYQVSNADILRCARSISTPISFIKRVLRRIRRIFKK